MKRHERILKTYLQNHKGKYLSDIERGKIEEKKIKIKNSRKKINNKFNDILQNRNNEQKDSNIEELNLLLAEDRKLKQKTHKNRLKELEKNEEFN